MNTRYRQRTELRIAELKDEGIVLHLGSRRYFTVSETGLRILELLREPRTLAELTRRLVDRYDVTEEHAEQSVRQFIAACRDANLLVAVRSE